MSSSSSFTLLSPASISGPFKIESLCGHLYFIDSIRSFCELNIADDFIEDSTQLTAQVIADRHQYHPERLYRLLRHLTFANIVQAVEQTSSNDPVCSTPFRLTSDGQLLKSSHPSQMRSLVLWEQSPCMRFVAEQRTSIIRQREDKYLPGIGVYIRKETGGKVEDPFLFLHRPPYDVQGKLFDGAMSAYSYSEVNGVVDAYKDIAQFHTLIDIGGNLGTLACRIAQHHSKLRAVVADLPPVISAARGKNEAGEMGVTDRVEYVEIDFFQVDSLINLFSQYAPVGHKWAISMKHILHDWSDEQTVTILSNIRQAVLKVADRQVEKPTLILIEQHFQGKPDTDWYVSGFDMLMLTAAGGKQRGKVEWMKLFDQTGWQWKGLTPCKGTAVSVVEAIMPQ